jgi:uncharacterized membrane protein
MTFDAKWPVAIAAPFLFVLGFRCLAWLAGAHWGEGLQFAAIFVGFLALLVGPAVAVSMEVAGDKWIVTIGKKDTPNE